MTLRLEPELKKKAARLAVARGLTVSQFIEELIFQADGSPTLGPEQIRAIVREEMSRNKNEK